MMSRLLIAVLLLAQCSFAFGATPTFKVEQLIQGDFDAAESAEVLFTQIAPEFHALLAQRLMQLGLALQSLSDTPVYSLARRDAGVESGATGEVGATGEFTSGSLIEGGTGDVDVTTGSVSAATTGVPASVTTGSVVQATTGSVVQATTASVSTTGLEEEGATGVAHGSSGTTGTPATTGTTGVVVAATGEQSVGATSGENINSGTTAASVAVGTTGIPIAAGSTGSPIVSTTARVADPARADVELQLGVFADLDTFQGDKFTCAVYVAAGGSCDCTPDHPVCDGARFGNVSAVSRKRAAQQLSVTIVFTDDGSGTGPTPQNLADNLATNMANDPSFLTNSIASIVPGVQVTGVVQTSPRVVVTTAAIPVSTTSSSTSQGVSNVQSDNGSNSGLSDGAIAGIVIGSVVFAAIVIVLAGLVVVRQRQHEKAVRQVKREHLLREADEENDHVVQVADIKLQNSASSPALMRDESARKVTADHHVSDTEEDSSVIFNLAVTGQNSLEDGAVVHSDSASSDSEDDSRSASNSSDSTSASANIGMKQSAARAQASLTGEETAVNSPVRVPADRNAWGKETLTYADAIALQRYVNTNEEEGSDDEGHKATRPRAESTGSDSDSESSSSNSSRSSMISNTASSSRN